MEKYNHPDKSEMTPKEVRCLVDVLDVLISMDIEQREKRSNSNDRHD